MLSPPVVDVPDGQVGGDELPPESHSEEPPVQPVAMPEPPADDVSEIPVAGDEPSPAQKRPEIEFIPETPPLDVKRIFPEGSDLNWLTVVLRPNDTLSKVFKRNGIDSAILFDLLAMPGTRLLQVVHPGDELTIATGSDGNLVGMEFRRDRKGSLLFVFEGRQIEQVEASAAKQAGSLRQLFDRQHRVVQQEKHREFKQVVAALQEKTLVWHDATVGSGDTLSHIFKRLDIDGALEIASAPTGNWLRSGLMPKQLIRIATDSNGAFAMLEVPDYKTEKVRMVIADDERFAVGFRKMETEAREFQACATIRSNLYAAGKLAGIPYAVVDEFAQVFASRIDFSRQLQQGDRYCLIYERYYVDDRQINRVGLVAASLRQQGHHTQAFRMTSDTGDVTYYDQHGVNMQGHFLRAPVKSARVTSVFSNNRFHPVLKIYRKHQGVDYGAPRGTPIMATADGIVSQRRYNRSGYGRLIVIRHGSKYETLYAHMHKFGKNTSVGSYVKRGQVIGYVGSTGVSTGDHVHYEFRVNGVHRDPLNYPMPKGRPVPEDSRVEFDRMVAEISEQLLVIDQSQLASN